jgi:hypothetical protein
MLPSVRLRSVAIYFRTPPEAPKRQVKPWSQKIEPSTWLDPPIQTYNDVGPKWEGANHNMAEVGRFFESRRVRGPRSAGLPYGSILVCSASGGPRAFASLGNHIGVSR